MKKITTALALCLVCATTVCAQTYEEWCDRAITAIGRDSLEQAERCIRAALALEPSNPHNALLFSNLGTVQRQMGRDEQALESYTYALNLAPRAVPILLNRATLYIETGRNDAARVDYSLVLDLDKDNQEALRMRAYIYMQMHDYKAAKADYEHLLRLAPTDFNGRLGLATLKQKMGKPADALLLLNALIAECETEENSRRAMLHVARAGVENDLHHIDLALVDLEEALRLDASQAEAYIIRGQIYLSQDKKVLAKRDFEEAVSLGVPRSELHELIQSCR